MNLEQLAYNVREAASRYQGYEILHWGSACTWPLYGPEGGDEHAVVVYLWHPASKSRFAMIFSEAEMRALTLEAVAERVAKAHDEIESQRSTQCPLT